tara:strand:- start:1235 stop:2722 length:1488 start_codon:yes stop_codon:yes gene_type:complete
MPVTIEQKPLSFSGSSNTCDLPIGQPLIFGVSYNTIVATKQKVKFIAEVHVSSYPINLSTVDDVVGTYKTSPNNRGIGIFDFRTILETHLKSDNMGSTKSLDGSTFKGYGKSTEFTMPLHLIDKYSLGDNTIKYFAIQFKIEYAEPGTSLILNPGDGGNTGNARNSIQYTMYNGVVSYDDKLDVVNRDFGYDMGQLYMAGADSLFLTQAPLIQYASMTDYGTSSFLNFLPKQSVYVKSVKLRYYDSNGVALGVESLWNAGASGGAGGGGAAYVRLVYFGIAPANLRGWSTLFTANINNIAYYTYQAYDATSPTALPLSQLYRMNILCDNSATTLPDSPSKSEKGYEYIRITWLNKWGTWDYYTFTMKSIRSIKTKRIPYTQMTGTWNSKYYEVQGYRGGKKNFRVNTTEMIKFNSDFVTEEEGDWFEQLIGSTEVYILEGYSKLQDPAQNVALNTEVQPITITTSKFIRKTIANDKLMQYTFEAEKAKVNRTQAV